MHLQEEDAMDITSITPDQPALHVEKQTRYVNQLFEQNADLSDIFARIAAEDAEFSQQILNKSEDSIKTWFLSPKDYIQAVQAMALLAPFFGPQPELESLGQTWLLPAVRCCLNGMEHAFNFDSEAASRKIATHLLSLNSAFTQCDNLEQTRKLLHAMFTEQQLHWALFVDK